jgi:WD40 repeat protein
MRQSGDDGIDIAWQEGPPFTNDVALDWRPQSEWLCGTVDNKVTFWKPGAGTSVKVINNEVSWPCIIDWSPNGELLSIDSGDTAGVYRVPSDPEHPTLEQKLLAFSGGAYGICWSPASDRFAYITDIAGGTSQARVHRLSGSEEVTLRLPGQPEGRLRWSATMETLAVPVHETICIVNPDTGRVITELKGHTRWVFALAFSPDERLMASIAWDHTIRLWASEDWRLLATIELSQTIDIMRTNWFGLAFHPVRPLLCSVGTEGGISLYELDIDGLLGAPAAPVKRYATAKVVLVGESGVGKTGLGYRLAMEEYKEHSSTHGQQFWVVDSLTFTRDDGLRCEVVLWDLAG